MKALPHDTTNVYKLASMANCSIPDSTDSLGAMMLLRVQSMFNATFVDGYDLKDALYEIADTAPSTSIHAMWQEFVDLKAYQEEVEAWPSDSIDRSKGMAETALYQIALRLAHALYKQDRNRHIPADDIKWEECHRCGDSMLVISEPFIHRGTEVWQTVSCSCCKHEWTEVYVAKERVDYGDKGDI